MDSSRQTRFSSRSGEAPQNTKGAGRRRRDGAQALYQAALELFVERGYHLATTAAISKRAGMSAAALYAHFPSKEELAWRLFRDINVRAAEGLREELASCATAYERVETFIRHAFEWTMANRNEAVFLFLIRHSEFFGRDRQLKATGRAELVQLFTGIIELGQQTGEIPAMNATDLQALRKATGIPLVFVRDWLGLGHARSDRVRG